jgi:hypothetical protein
MKKIYFASNDYGKVINCIDQMISEDVSFHLSINKDKKGNINYIAESDDYVPDKVDENVRKRIFIR